MVPVAVAAIVAGTTIAVSQSAKNQQKKAQARAEDVARQEQERAQAEQQRIEEKFALTPGELERQDRTFELEEKRQTELERRAGLPGEDLLKEVGPTTRALLEQIAARQGKTSSELFTEEGGEPARLLLEEVSRPGPLAPFEGELELALQKARQSLGTRGITPTGRPGDIGLESFGRAAVDASVAAARERVAQRSSLSTQLFNISGGARAEAGNLAERGVEEQRVAREELSRFLGDIQTLEQGAQGRQASGAAQSAQVFQPTIREFGAVPVDLAAQDIGAARAREKDAIEGLSSIGTGLATGGVSTTAGQAPGSLLEDLVTRRKKRDPGADVGLLTGGKGFG